MNINLSIINFALIGLPNPIPDGYIYPTGYAVRYSRIDNITNPVWIPLGTKAQSDFPLSISNVANGQYEVGITPVYADGRAVQEIVKQTNACQSVVALNAVQTGSNLVITYTALDTAAQVYLTVIYPNGGSFKGAYTNGANDSTILMPIPVGVDGVYTVYMQSICDPDTNFYSPPSPPVTVTVGVNTVDVSSTVGGAVVTQVNGISGFALTTSISAGQRNQGTHDTFTGAISAVFTGTPAVTSHATLTVNGTLQQCLNLPNTDGGSIMFDSRTYFSTDIIAIGFSNGAC